MKSLEFLLAETEQISVLTIWDSGETVAPSGGITYTWNGYQESGEVRSLFRYVEKNAERLRSRYAEWIHDLGEFRVDGISVVEHLAIYPDLSYWWLTLLVEKSPWKSPAIVDAVRLLAVEEILTAMRPVKVVLVSSNSSVCESISGLCEALRMDFSWQRLTPPASSRWGKRRIYRSLPPVARGLVHLTLHVWERWPFRKAAFPGWFGGADTVLFCSYFFNIDVKEGERGKFKSRYWGRLPELLPKMNLKGNWLEHYPPHPAISGPTLAKELASKINANGVTEGRHGFVDSFLSATVIIRVLINWVKLLAAARKLQRVSGAFRPRGSRVSLWPLMRHDWYESLHGVDCVRALLSRELLDEAVRSLPTQKNGFYLCENHAWERAFIQSWRRHKHGVLTAVVHATVRFWDLRYFHDSRSLSGANRFSLPQPDRTALNGAAVMEAYRRMGYPDERLVTVEALRYNHLKYSRGMDSGMEGGSRKILILGDYVPSATEKLLKVVADTAPLLPVSYSYAVKPHPSCQVNLTEYSAFDLHIRNEPLDQILRSYDIAFSANWTSAAVDAYVAGLPVVVMLDETELNLSPLREMPGVHFVSDPRQLAEALASIASDVAQQSQRKNLFFLDPALPRWQRLLAS
ncbi:MAG: hypothetical protein H0W69_00395 [Gemmatimonadaceae bacterium]|nr:hypothetical protein [Gemmatimonadaceae bacterium]